MHIILNAMFGMALQCLGLFSVCYLRSHILPFTLLHISASSYCNVDLLVLSPVNFQCQMYMSMPARRMMVVPGKDVSFERRHAHDDVIKWKHFPRYWPSVRGNHRSPVNSPHKGQWRRALMFSLICVWINGWVNNREAGDLRCYRAHYYVIVMAGVGGRGGILCISGIIISVSKINYTDKLSITTNTHRPWYSLLHLSDMLVYEHLVTVGMALYKIIKVPGSLDWNLFDHIKQEMMLKPS